MVVPEANQSVFRIGDKPAKMLRADLDAARAAWLKAAKTDVEREERAKSGFLTYHEQDGRIVDFHALRHAFITNLARAGIHPKPAQDLARHSDINLTMSRYSHTELDEQAAALRSLPSIARPARVEPAASATNGSMALPAVSEPKPQVDFLPPHLPEKGSFQCTLKGANGRAAAPVARRKLPENKSVTAKSPRESKARPRGFEPPTCGLGIF